MSFTFDNNEPEELDLNSGGDTGVNKKPEKSVPVSPFKAPVRQNKDILNKLGRPGLNRPVNTPSVQAPPIPPRPSTQRPQVAPPTKPSLPTPTVAPRVQQVPVSAPIYETEPYPQEVIIEDDYLAEEINQPISTSSIYSPPQPRTESTDPNQLFGNQISEDQPEAVPQKKKGFFQPKNKKPVKRNNFAGNRNKILAVRIGVIAVGAILILSGLKSIVLPPSGPSKAQVQSAAQEAVGYTSFPTVEGGGIAVGFTKAFLNYSGDAVARDTREKLLLNYAPESVINLIDPTFSGKTLTTDSNPGNGLDTSNQTGEGDTSGDAVEPASPDDAQPVEQTVTDGPYLIGSDNIDDTHALFTTLTQVNSATWLYLQIPVLYDSANESLAVSGSPSFIPPTKVAKVLDSVNTPTWSEDTEVEAKLQPDLINYLKAWASSNKDVISRYVTPKATLQAKTGLGGMVEYSRFGTLSVESVTKENPTPNTRRAQFSVSWLDPNSHAVYTQNYRLVIKYVGTKWYIDDIKNPSLISGKSAVDTSSPAN